MLSYWFDSQVLFDLNEKLRESPVIVVRDYVVVYGVPYEWIEAMNLKDREVIMRVEFVSYNDIELGIGRVELYPEVNGFGVLNYWLAGIGK